MSDAARKLDFNEMTLRNPRRQQSSGQAARPAQSDRNTRAPPVSAENANRVEDIIS